MVLVSTIDDRLQTVGISGKFSPIIHIFKNIESLNLWMNISIKEETLSRKFDSFVKSPSATLRCILRHCGVPICTPHSSWFARLASEAFYFAIVILSFYDFIKFGSYSNPIDFEWWNIKVIWNGKVGRRKTPVNLKVPRPWPKVPHPSIMAKSVGT